MTVSGSSGTDPLHPSALTGDDESEEAKDEALPHPDPTSPESAAPGTHPTGEHQAEINRADDPPA